MKILSLCFGLLASVLFPCLAKAQCEVKSTSLKEGGVRMKCSPETLYRNNNRNHDSDRGTGQTVVTWQLVASRYPDEKVPDFMLGVRYYTTKPVKVKPLRIALFFENGEILKLDTSTLGHEGETVFTVFEISEKQAWLLNHRLKSVAIIDYEQALFVSSNAESGLYPRVLMDQLACLGYKLENE